MPSRDIILQWYEYDALLSHMHTLAERNFVAAKWANFKNSIRDSVIYNLLPQRQMERMSELSTELKSRLADWAVIPSCEYNRGLKVLRVKLIVASDNVVDPNFTYDDDLRYLAHVYLQLTPAFDIITRYLEAPEIGLRETRVLELTKPQYAQELPHTGFFLSKYQWDASTSSWKRKGMPFAASVFLTYAPFEL